MEQHERWSAARERLWHSEPPKPKPKPVRRVPSASVVDRIRRENERRMVMRRPELAIIFPSLSAYVEAGYPPASVVYQPENVFPPKWRVIAQEVAAKHGISIRDIISHRRDVPTVKARHEAFWRCRKETTYSIPQIGHHFGQRDHTTVLNGIRRHEERMRAESVDGGCEHHSHLSNEPVAAV